MQKVQVLAAMRTLTRAQKLRLLLAIIVRVGGHELDGADAAEATAAAGGDSVKSTEHDASFRLPPGVMLVAGFIGLYHALPHMTAAMEKLHAYLVERRLRMEGRTATAKPQKPETGTKKSKQSKKAK